MASLNVKPCVSAATFDKKAATGIVIFAVALFFYSHARGFSIAAFSDDIALVRLLAERAADGGLLADMWARWSGPLSAGGMMWRPIPYASYAIDAWLHADNVPYWRMTNVLLHVSTALAVGLFMWRLGRSWFAGAVAFALFLLQPWAPEVSLWIVGRYDAFATFAIALSLTFAVMARGADRYVLLSLLAAIFAYASKESAAVLLGLVLLALVADDALARGRVVLRSSPRTLMVVGAHLLLLLAYVFLRRSIFDTASVNVYRSEQIASIAALASSTARYAMMPASFSSLAPVAATATLVGLIVAAGVAAQDGRTRVVSLLGFAMAMLVMVALAIVFPHPDGGRDGWRMYHLISVGIAIVAAAALLGVKKRTAIAVVCVGMISLAVWQRAAVEEWRHASNTMMRLQSEIKRVGESAKEADYALLAVPDALGRVPFARNAQGGLLLAHSGDRERISQMIIATDDTLREWKTLSDEGVVKRLTKRASAPDAPTVFYCFDGTRLINLGFWRSTTQADWDSRWQGALHANCPVIKYRQGSAD